MSSEDSKPSVSKPSVSTQGDTSPPSPRTLTAIQAAMNGSSDEEKVDQDEKDGGVSPRTLLAIQRAMAEEEEEEDATEQRTLISSSPTKPQVHICHPVPQVVISSSDEETELDVLPNANSLSNEKSNFKENPTGQSVKDNLFVSSSEDEIEEVIGERNKALCFAAAKQPHRGSDRQKEAERQREVQVKSEEETKKEKLTDKREEPFKKTETHPLLPEQRRNESNVLQEKNGGDVKSESSEESESEGNILFKFRLIHHFLNKKLLTKELMFSQRASSRYQKKNFKRRMQMGTMTMGPNKKKKQRRV